MNYGNWTGCNFRQTDADGIISPDILFIVHKAKDKSIYLKQILPQLHIIRFQKDSAISLNTECIRLYYQAAPNQALILGSQSSSPQNDVAELSHGV